MTHLQKAWKVQRPALVLAEDALTLAALMKLHASEDVVHVHLGLRAVLWGMCELWGVHFSAAHNATYRKHFIGRANMGGRADTKAAVLARCKMLKLIPMDCFDDDRADALAVWDWGCATFGQRSAGIQELFMMGEVPRG